MEQVPASGNILVHSRVCDPESRAQLRYLLDNLYGERVNANLYEVFTADWDEGLWGEEVERIQTIINPQTDTLIFWQAFDSQLIRTCLAGPKV